MTDRLVPIAECARPHGIRGEVKVHLYNDASDLLFQRKHWILQNSEGKQSSATIETIRSTPQGIILKLQGISDRTESEKLRGTRLCCMRSEFPPLEEGEFYACDLEGLSAVLSSSGETIGTVQTLVSYPTCSALLITRPNGRTLEIPLLENYVERVDIAAGQVRLKSIDVS